MNKDTHQPIYLDHHATTPVDPRVLAAMLPYFTEHFGNPTSTTHQYGWAAEAAVTSARETIAAASRNSHFQVKRLIKYKGEKSINDATQF